MGFKRSSQDSIEDVWDDTALIEAYDRAVNLAKEKVAAKLAAEDGASSSVNEAAKLKETSNACSNTSAEKKWKTGDYVTTTYSEDGITYEAVIESINNASTCIVKYIGYDNKEKVLLKDLQPSNGPQSRKIQIEASREFSSDEMECEVSDEASGQNQKVRESSALKWEPVQSVTGTSGKSNAFIPPPPPPAAWPSGGGSKAMYKNAHAAIRADPNLKKTSKDASKIVKKRWNA